MINPRKMCKQHISGEHNELHKHLPSLLSGCKIDGRFSPIVQIQLNMYVERHNELAKFLNHKSPLQIESSEIFKNIYPRYYDMVVDVKHNMKDLYGRCKQCNLKNGA